MQGTKASVLVERVDRYYKVRQNTTFVTDLNHHGDLHMTEQFKLVTNAQESKILNSNVTTIKIKCSNNFPRPYSVEITYISLE